jgi:hypothetical protein
VTNNELTEQGFSEVARHANMFSVVRYEAGFVRVAFFEQGHSPHVARFITAVLMPEGVVRQFLVVASNIMQEGASSDPLPPQRRPN